MPVETTEEGRIYFSSAGRSLEGEDEIEVTSVGVDIGSSTSHLVFSRIILERLDSRYVVSSREAFYESEILLTPYAGGETIDADALGAFIAKQYKKAGIKPDEIDTGALILTGVAVRRSNARKIGELFAEQAGKFVAVSAGDNLETTMAAYGSGAAARSIRDQAAIINVDIGGGTAKIAICRGGRVVDLTAVDVGARLVCLDKDRKVVRIEEAGKRIAADLGIAVELGATVTQEQADALAARMADLLFEAMKGGNPQATGGSLLRLDRLSHSGEVKEISFSGGVAEYIYGREATSFGDLGPALAREIKQRVEGWGPTLVKSNEGIRATVIGAAQFSVQVSGNTILISHPEQLPVRNLPVLICKFGLGETIDQEEVTGAVKKAIGASDLVEGEGPVALSFPWSGTPDYPRFAAVAKGLAAALPQTLANGHAIVLLIDGDVGMTLGRILTNEVAPGADVIAIDGVQLKEFDYVDIGTLIQPADVVPVIIKSLLF